MKKIGVFTSGGDAPGMNACIRSVVRTALERRLEVMGIYRGYDGMIDDYFEPLGPRSVSNIVQRGGTIIHTARSERFCENKWRKIAAENILKHKIDGVIAIGGDGTFHGAHKIGNEFGIKIVGVPGTIDNDLYGTDYTIGFDTAVNTALEMIDKIRDTAAAHERNFFIEVMGRHAGFIALNVGIGAGAEQILIPEVQTDVESVAKKIEKGKERGKTSSIVIVAEGDDAGNAYEIAEKVRKITGAKYRVSVLGYVQRGGNPTAFDRILASKIGAYSVDALIEGCSDVMVGEVQEKRSIIPLEETWTKKKGISPFLLQLADILAK